MEFESLMSYGRQKWIWTRKYDTYGDPITGPTSAIFLGAFLLHLLVYLFIDVFNIPSLATNHGTIITTIASAMTWMSSIREERVWIDWLLILLFCVSIYSIQQDLINQAMLRKSEDSYKSILVELKEAKDGLIRLSTQDVPSCWKSADLLETAYGRHLFRRNLDLHCGMESASIEGKLNVVVPRELSGASTLRVLVFEATETGADTRFPRAASYSLLNPYMVPYIVLADQVSPKQVWSKFTFLHELGHLRGMGRKSLLLRGELTLILSGCLGAAGFLWSPAIRTNALDASGFFAFAIYTYLLWSWAKWRIWDRWGYVELCADLFAFGNLATDEIDRALDLRIKSLEDRQPSRLLRRLSLKWLRFRCGRTPSHWLAAAERPPLQAKLPTFLFSGTCALLSFVADIPFFVALTAWIAALFARQVTLAARKRALALDEEFMLYVEPEAPVK